MAGFLNHFGMFVASIKISLVVYGCLLLTWDMIFSYLPSTILGVILVYSLFAYFSVPLPPQELLTEVFGEDANILIEKYRRKEMEDLSFIPTTSRLAKASMSPTSSKNGIIQSRDGKSKPYIMWTIAHRGAGLDAPENSLSAFRLCRSRGCLAVEFDVALTKDNVAVVFHDDTLARIANIDRDIRDMTWEELKQVDISVNHPLVSRFTGERIPTFDEAITTCLELDLRFFIDLKDSDSMMVQVVLDAYQKHGEAMYKRAVVSSFYPQLIYQIRRRDPRVIGCMAWRPSFNEYYVWNGDLQNLESRHAICFTQWFAILHDMVLKWALPNVLWWFLGLSALLINKDGVTKEETSHWMKKGLRIFAWTVNDPVEKLHFTHNFQMGCLTDTMDGGNLSPKPSVTTVRQHAATETESQSSIFVSPAEDSTTTVTDQRPRAD